MPHETLKLVPGVDQNKTLTLNEAAVSICNLVRLFRDRSGLGLWQKLGGWTRFFPTAMPAIVRAMWAWQDTNDHKWLAVGCGESTTPSAGSPVQVIHSDANIKRDITPTVRKDDVAVDVSTIAGDSIVEIGDTGSSATSFDAVFIPTHIAVGGIIVFGFYRVIPASANTFQVKLIDKLGNPVFAVSTVTNGGSVAAFTATSGSPFVNVLLTAHGFVAGDTYPVLISTTVGGISLEGNYIVQTVVDANNFTILAANQATSTATVSINGGNARYDFYLGKGPLPAGSGYGVGGYGTGGYGSGTMPSPSTGDNISSTDWTLDNWGDLLIAVPCSIAFGAIDVHSSRTGGPIYYWSPISSTDTLIAIPEGPVANDGAFVAMPQRQIIAWASTFNGVQDHLLLRWCDVDNFFSWIGTPTNRAGSRRLSTGSRIIFGMQVAQQALIWTDVSLWSMNYTGGQGVYSINEVGKNCGLIARKAAGTLLTNAYWMGQSQFFTYASNGAVPFPCPIWDVVYQNLDKNNVDKIRFFSNSLFNEIGWYYPSVNGNGEIDSYVKCNILLGENGWDMGLLRRTAWINQSVLGEPIGADGDLLMQHETSNDADGQPMNSYFRTGYFVLNEGDELVFVDQVWPDMKWGQYGSTSKNAQLLLTFYVAEYPADNPDPTIQPTAYGPFTLDFATKYVSPRFRGRLVSIEMRSVDLGSFWRLGGLRHRWQFDGKFL